MVALGSNKLKAEVPVSMCTELSKSDKVIQIVIEWTC